MNIKELRESKGWTLMKLAQEVGVSYTTIQMWDKGVSEPNEENMAKLCKILGVENE